MTNSQIILVQDGVSVSLNHLKEAHFLYLIITVEIFFLSLQTFPCVTAKFRVFPLWKN